jgi:hypothetical protein
MPLANDYFFLLFRLLTAELASRIVMVAPLLVAGFNTNRPVAALRPSTPVCFFKLLLFDECDAALAIFSTCNFCAWDASISH